MPVLTRAQANRRLEEATIFRSIKTNDVVEYTYTVTTVSATGLGVHVHWVYSDKPLPDSRIMDMTPQNSKFLGIQQIEPKDVQGERPRSQGSTSEHASTEDSTEPSSPVTPPPPITPLPRERTNKPPSTRLVADTNMKLFLEIRKDEDIEEAVRRHLELCFREAGIRKRENQRRIYEFIKTRPQLLRDVDEDTEVVVREDSGPDRNPFL